MAESWAFLIGAGFSADAEIPTTGPMVEDFLRSLRPSRLKQYTQAIVERLPPDKRDVEGLLEALQLLSDPAHLAWGFGRVPRGMRNVKRASVAGQRLRAYIRSVCNPAPSRIQYISDLLDAVALYRPVTIFSFNYDSGIEIACHALGWTYDTGFAGVWRHAPVVNSPSAGESIRLFKLHGSVLWFRASHAIWELPLAHVSSDATTITGEGLEPVILYPGDKERLHLPPFSPLHEQWHTALVNDIRLLIVVGYSFRDAYVRDIIREWLSPGDRVLVVVDPDVPILHRVQALFGERTVTLPLAAIELPSTLVNDTVAHTNLLNALRSAPGELQARLVEMRDPNIRHVENRQVVDTVSYWLKCGLLDLALPLLEQAIGTQTAIAIAAQLDLFTAAWVLVWTKLRGRSPLLPVAADWAEQRIRALPPFHIATDGHEAYIPAPVTVPAVGGWSRYLRRLLADGPVGLQHIEVIEATRIMLQDLQRLGQGTQRRPLPDWTQTSVQAFNRTVEDAGVVRYGGPIREGGTSMEGLIDVRASLLASQERVLGLALSKSQ